MCQNGTVDSVDPVYLKDSTLIARFKNYILLGKVDNVNKRYTKVMIFYKDALQHCTKDNNNPGGWYYFKHLDHCAISNKINVLLDIL